MPPERADGVRAARRGGHPMLQSVILVLVVTAALVALAVISTLG
jgi:hypothetical protein